VGGGFQGEKENRGEITGPGGPIRKRPTGEKGVGKPFWTETGEQKNGVANAEPKRKSNLNSDTTKTPPPTPPPPPPQPQPHRGVLTIYDGAVTAVLRGRTEGGFRPVQGPRSALGTVFAHSWDTKEGGVRRERSAKIGQLKSTP